MILTSELDRRVRARMVGRRLVCEVDWPEDLVTEVLLAVSGLQNGGADPRTIGADYPGVLVLSLVTNGIRRYEGHELWPGTGWTGSQQRRAGEAFEGALAVLGLETFRQFRTPGFGARRFVSVILAHGGIPASVAPRFFTNALFPALREGAVSGEELVAAWRANPPAVSKPVERFVLYGGEVVVDLLDRLIALTGSDRAAVAADPGSVGLPRHLVAAFLGIAPTAVARVKLRPRPSVSIDPWSDEGPMVRLPAVGQELARAGFAWTVDAGAETVARAASALVDSRVPLAPALFWRITSHGPDGMAATVFECFGESRLACFDGAGDYLRDTTGIRTDEAWILTPPGVSVGAADGDGVRSLEIAEGPTTLGGPWSGHALARYRLAGVAAIVATEAGAEVARVAVTRDARPELSGLPVRDLRDLATGGPIFPAMPALVLPPWGDWHVELGSIETDGSERQRIVRDLVVEGAATTVELAGPAFGAGPGLPFGRYELSVRGRIGSDFRPRFTVVPGLRIEVPEDPLPPEVGAIAVPASADRDVGIHGKPPGVPAEIEFEAGQVVCEVWARHHRRKVGTLLRLPRIRWALRDPGATTSTLGVVVLAFEPEVVRSGSAILVELGRPGRRARVDLATPTGTIQTGEVRTAEADAPITFDLGRFRDTVRGNSSIPLSFVLAIENQTLEIARHRPPPPEPRPPERDRVLPAHDGPRLNCLTTGSVYAVRATCLEIALIDGSRAVAYADHLPKPIFDYRVGDEVTGTIYLIAERCKIDLRVQAERRTLGDRVQATVREVRGRALLAAVGSAEAIIGAERLPEPLATYTPGTRLEARVIAIAEGGRRLRLAVAPFDPTGFPDGLAVRGPILEIDGAGIFVGLERVIGFVPKAELPDGVTPGSFRTGDLVAGWVERSDRSREQMTCSLRPFNPGGLRVGDRVRGRVGVAAMGLLRLRLSGGEAAVVFRDGLLPERPDPVRDYQRRTDVEGLVRVVDPGHRHLVVSLVGDLPEPGAAAGDARPALRRALSRREPF
jgi:hypothetical protein